MRQFIIIFFSTIQLGYAGVHIEGTASAFKGENLVVQAYRDFITNSTYTLKKIVLDEKGWFSVDLNISEQTLVIFKIRDRASDFYVLPDKKYHLILRDDDQNNTRLFDKRLNIRFEKAPTNELNTLLAEFSERYAQFLEDNYQSFVSSGAKEVVAKFKAENLSYFSPKGNKVFMQSLKYLLGNLEDATVHNKKTIYDELLHAQGVLYHNQEFMSFFIQFYQDRFRQLALGKDGFEMLTCVNQTTDVARLKSILKNDKYLDEDAKIELFIINGLHEVFNDPTFKKNMVEKMLDQIANQSDYQEHRNIARNILLEKRFMKPGTKAPSFDLVTSTGKEISSDGLKGKYKYVQFWAPWSVPSVKEQLLIKRLFDKYGDKIQFVSITSESLDAFLQKNSEPSHPWTFLFSTYKSNIFEDYRVRSIPTYLVLDESNHVVQYPAESPVSIEKLLYEISIK